MPLKRLVRRGHKADLYRTTFLNTRHGGAGLVMGWSHTAKIVASWSGPLCKVTYNNGAGVDIYPLANGKIDSATILAMCGSGELFCRIDTIYDQTGNGNHLVQTVDRFRPLLNPALLDADGYWGASFTAYGGRTTTKNGVALATTELNCFMRMTIGAPVFTPTNHTMFAVIECMTNAGMNAPNTALVGVAAASASWHISYQIGNAGAATQPAGDIANNSGLIVASGSAATLITPVVAGPTFDYGKLMLSNNRQVISCSQSASSNIADFVHVPGASTGVIAPQIVMMVNDDQKYTAPSTGRTGSTTLSKLSWGRMATSAASGGVTEENAINGAAHVFYAGGFYANSMYQTSTNVLATATPRFADGDQLRLNKMLMDRFNITTSQPTQILMIGSSSASGYCSVTDGPARKLRKLLGDNNVVVDVLSQAGSPTLETDSVKTQIAKHIRAGKTKKIALIYNGRNDMQNSVLVTDCYNRLMAQVAEFLAQGFTKVFVAGMITSVTGTETQANYHTKCHDLNTALRDSGSQSTNNYTFIDFDDLPNIAVPFDASTPWMNYNNFDDLPAGIHLRGDGQGAVDLATRMADTIRPFI